MFNNSHSGSNYWLGVVDMLTSVLIVFILISYVDSILDIDNLKQIIVNEKKSRFIERFEKTLRETDKKKVSYKDEFDYLEITFGSNILFQPKKYFLSKKGSTLLKKCAEVILAYEDDHPVNIREIQVSGHTDKAPFVEAYYPKNNWELSTARALEVVNSMKKNGIDEDKLSASGYEDNRPISDSKEKNRRVEMKIFFTTLIE